jgi:hypothetical protein
VRCPECGNTVEYPTVDIGIGEVQCGPASCPECNWAEEDPKDKSEAGFGEIPWDEGEDEFT